MKLNSVALAGLVVAVAGCHVVKPVQPTVYIPEHNPPIVWVTYTDNSFVPVVRTRRSSGTACWARGRGSRSRSRFHLTEIQTVQAKMPSPKRTILLATVLTAATVGVAYTISTAGNGGDPNFTGCPVVKGHPDRLLLSARPRVKLGLPIAPAGVG